MVTSPTDFTITLRSYQSEIKLISPTDFIVTPGLQHCPIFMSINFPLDT